MEASHYLHQQKFSGMFRMNNKLPEKQQQNKAILIISSISDIALINRLYLK